MKKSKLITGFSAAFVALMALTSCGGLLRGKTGVVLTINGVEYTADDLFKDQKSAAASEAKFNAVYKVAVRQYFNTEGKDGKLKDIERDAQNKVSGQKDLAQSNASKNGTSYAEEWQKILDSNGVDDESGLYDKFEYELEKEEFDDQFYEKNLTTLKNGGELTKDVTVDGYIPKKQPYHVKHILVKVGAAENDPVTGEITEDQAQKLHDVVEALGEGKLSFGEIAHIYSDDDGSKAKYGDLGIMDRDTSFVNEFKLGTYLYESYFGSSTPNAKGKLFASNSKADGYADELSVLGDPSGNEVSAAGEGSGIGQIPYEAALALGEKYKIGAKDYKGYAKITDETQHFEKFMSDKVAAKYYPRNVIFNKYFNKNNIMVITPRRLSLNKAIDVATPDIDEQVKKYVNIAGDKKRIADDDYRGTVDNGLELLSGFKKDPKNADILNAKLHDDDGNTTSEGTGANNKVLRNQEGRVIFVFRSGSGSGDSGYQGIHFVCIERSPFIESETDAGKSEGVNLDEYYTYCYPGQTTTGSVKYPTYSDGSDKPTYVNDNTHVEVTELKSRADEVKGKIKGYDPNLNIAIYQYLLKVGDLKFKEGDDEAGKLAQAIKNDIDTWIDRKKESTKFDESNNWDKTWKEYCWKLEENTKRRVVQGESGDMYGGLISEACAIAFANYKVDTDATKLSFLFSAGGVFHD